MRILYEILVVLVLRIARAWILGEFDSKQSKQYFARSLNIKTLCERECPVKIGWFYDTKLKIESAWNFRPDRTIQSVGI